jgi:hypothetical protein
MLKAAVKKFARLAYPDIVLSNTIFFSDRVCDRKSVLTSRPRIHLWGRNPAFDVLLFTLGLLTFFSSLLILTDFCELFHR